MNKKLNTAKKPEANNKVIENLGLTGTIISNSPSGVFVIGENFRIIFANSRLENILGYEPGELNNIDFRQLVAPEDKDLATTQYLNRREQLDTPEDYQLMVIRKDDTRRRTRINVTLFTDEQGNKYTVGHVSDITEATVLK